VKENLTSQFFDHTPHHLLRDGDTGTARATECLYRHNLEIVRVAEAMLGPEVEMIASSDGSRRALTLSYGEKLREGARSRDGRRIVPSVGADLVCASVRREGTKTLGAAARVVIAVVLDDVVFGLRRVDPAVHG
jgi:hypothetical protein